MFKEQTQEDVEATLASVPLHCATVGGGGQNLRPSTPPPVMHCGQGWRRVGVHRRNSLEICMHADSLSHGKFATNFYAQAPQGALVLHAAADTFYSIKSEHSGRPYQRGQNYYKKTLYKNNF